MVGPKPVVGLDEETAEEMIARQLGHAKIFVVKGVDRQTLGEKTMKITADSKESAEFKAELEGMIVTVVYEELG